MAAEAPSRVSPAPERIFWENLSEWKDMMRAAGYNMDQLTRNERSAIYQRKVALERRRAEIKRAMPVHRDFVLDQKQYKLLLEQEEYWRLSREGVERSWRESQRKRLDELHDARMEHVYDNVKRLYETGFSIQTIPVMGPIRRTRRKK